MGRNGVGQDDARLRADGPPGYEVTAGRGPLEGPRRPQAERPTSAAAWASSSPSSTRPRSPACRWPASCAPRSTRAAGRSIAGDRRRDATRPTRPGAASGWATSAAAAREDGAAQARRRVRRALRQRGLLRRREEAPGDAPDGRPRSRRWRSSTRPTRGLDIDALRIVAEGVNAQLNPDLGVLLITHYQRLLNYIKPDVVHVLAQGLIVAPAAATSRCDSRRRATLRSCAKPASRTPTTSQRRPSPRSPAPRTDEELS